MVDFMIILVYICVLKDVGIRQGVLTVMGQGVNRETLGVSTWNF